MSAAVRVAEVIRSCWEAYNGTHRLPPHVVKAVRHILACRTAVLGGHIHACDRCGSQVPMYNSCQNRHCPTCQTSAKEKWLAKRRRELLPVRYFHCVFTVSHDLNALIDANRKLLLGELFTTRFCYHILPPGFRKIRYYGWLSAAKRKKALPAIRAALDAAIPEPEPDEPLPERILRRTGIDITLCPNCHKGHLRNTGITVPPKRGPPR